MTNPVESQIVEEIDLNDVPNILTTSPYNLTLYQVGDDSDWIIEQASSKRNWMSANNDHAYRCLPLTMANQAGWIIRLPFSMTAIWNGNQNRDTVRFELDDPLNKYWMVPSNLFGNGIITFNLPWLFRAERKGVNLLVRGCPNFLKTNATPLEGLVEIDWVPFTFTMNWKIQDWNRPVQFTKGDPIGFIQPMCVDIIEATQLQVKHPRENPSLLAEYTKWNRMRKLLNNDPMRPRSEWQKFYHDGPKDKSIKHRTKIILKKVIDTIARRPAKVESGPQITYDVHNNIISFKD